MANGGQSSLAFGDGENWLPVVLAGRHVSTWRWGLAVATARELLLPPQKGHHGDEPRTDKCYYTVYWCGLQSIGH